MDEDDEMPKPPVDGEPEEGMDAESLAATSYALDAVADDLVDTAALARLTGFDDVWRDQIRVTQAARSMVAEAAAQWQRQFHDLGGLTATKEFVEAQQKQIRQEVLDSLAVSNQAMLEEIRRTISAPAGRIVASYREMTLPLTREFDKFIEIIKSHRAPNWPGGDDALPASVLSTFVKETRWPLVWVPEPGVVVALVNAPTADRDAVLLSHRDTILSNCAAVLDECAGEVVAELVPYAKEAVEVAKDGHVRAAQAQAAAVVTTVLEVHLEFPTLGQAARDLTFDPDDISLDRARIGYILSCIPQSLTKFGAHAGGAPIPEHFNRHATLHRVCDVQYSLRNALVSLMLVTALLREIDELDLKDRWDSLFT